MQRNAGLSLVEAAVRGAGVLLVDSIILSGQIERGELVSIMRDNAPTPGFPLQALYVCKRHMPGRVRVFIDAIRTRVQGMRPVTV
ncbi:MAG: hypothetical protein OXR73_29925 [Myxococcales bacterium]|nr:hypothetical protein [Myxococcales bacterium]